MMSESRTCQHQVGDTICGKVAVGYLDLRAPGVRPSDSRMMVCEEHIRVFETAETAPPVVRF